MRSKSERVYEGKHVLQAAIGGMFLGEAAMRLPESGWNTVAGLFGMLIIALAMFPQRRQNNG